MDSSNQTILSFAAEIRDIARSILQELTNVTSGGRLDITVISGEIVAIRGQNPTNVTISNVHGRFWHQVDHDQLRDIRTGMRVRARSLPISRPHPVRGDRTCFIIEKIEISEAG